MSIVTVHGPYTFGSKAIVEVGAAQATVNPANGLIWTFRLDQPSTRTTSLAWTFPTGTPASATGPGPHTVTFAGAGTKAVTAVATGVGEGGNPYPPAGTTNIPVTAVSGAAPQLLMAGGEGEEGEGVEEQSSSNGTWIDDPADFTVTQVIGFVEDNPDELERILDQEYSGKNRSTLVSHLEGMQEA